MNSHDENSVLILRYVLGDLTAPEMADFSRHLDVCDACRARVEEERSLSKLFRETAPLYTASDELRARVAVLLAAAPRKRGTLRTKIEETAAHIGHAIENSWRWGTGKWFPVLATALLTLFSLGILWHMLQERRAQDYVEAAVDAHREALAGQPPLQIQSDAPDTVTQWIDQRVSFHFRLPAAQAVAKGSSRFQLAGARLISLKSGGSGAMIAYHQQDQIVSLVVASAQTAVVAGGDEVQDGKLLFHYRNQAGFYVITWNNHGLAYALVSSVSGPARNGCLVCHGSLPAH